MLAQPNAACRTQWKVSNLRSAGTQRTREMVGFCLCETHEENIRISWDVGGCHLVESGRWIGEKRGWLNVDKTLIYIGWLVSELKPMIRGGGLEKCNFMGSGSHHAVAGALAAETRRLPVRGFFMSVNGLCGHHSRRCACVSTGARGERAFKDAVSPAPRTTPSPCSSHSQRRRNPKGGDA